MIFLISISTSFRERTKQQNCWICRHFAPDNIIPSRIWRTASYHWGKELRSLHSCSGQAGGQRFANPCPPAVWGKIRLHKGLDAHKSPDPPPGRVGDVVGGFQIVPALVGNQGIAEPTGLDGVQAVLLTPHLVDLIQLFRAGAGIRLQADVALGFEEIEHIVVVPLHQFPVALGTVAFGELEPILHQPLQALKCP